MKPVSAFIHRHPYISCAFGAVLGMVLTMDIIAWRGFGEGPSIFLYLYLAAGFVVSVIVDHRFPPKTTALLVALAVFFSSTPTLKAAEEPPQAESPGGLAAGAIVIVGGAITAIWLAKKCNRWFPRGGVGPTNVAERGAEYAASFSWADSDYCPMERQLVNVTPPVSCTLTLVTFETNCMMTVTVRPGHQHVQAMPEFREEVAGHGLELVSAPGRIESFARNGRPTFPEQVPIAFDWVTHTVSMDGGGVPVTVEASTDLREWTPILRVNLAPWSIADVGDATESRMQFYRVRMEEP